MLHDPNTHWETKDGKLLDIRSMGTDHLVNCARLIERKHQQFVESMLSNPPCFQGEMAQFTAEREWLEIAESGPEYISRSYEPLLNELSRRGVYLNG